MSFLEAEQSRKGAAADRSSRYYRWEVRLTPADVAKSLARYGSVGTVQDVVPRRLGVSGRVVELSVLGQRRARWCSRACACAGGWACARTSSWWTARRDAKGRVERFVFTGKGWGHGVGPVPGGRVRAWPRPARRYEEILQHYYTGITPPEGLRRLSPPLVLPLARLSP